MSKRELLLLILVVILSGVMPLLLVFYNWDYIDQAVQRAAPTVPVVPPPEAEQAAAGAADAAEEASWRPLARLDYMLGPWQTQDGAVHAFMASRSTPEGQDPDVFWLQPFRLTLSSDGRPVVVCGLYEALHTEVVDELPWRRGYCQNVGTKGRAIETRVYLMKQQGESFVRLLIGSDIDLDLYQEP